MMKNRDWHKDFSEIPGLQKAGYRHRDSGVASPRFLHINTEKNLCLYLLFISYLLCLSKIQKRTHETMNPGCKNSEIPLL